MLNELLIERSDYISSQGPLAIARSHWPGKDKCSLDPRIADYIECRASVVERRWDLGACVHNSRCTAMSYQKIFHTTM